MQIGRCIRLGAAALLVLVLSQAAIGGASATALPATISENTTLTSAGSPYTGTTVTISPGVTVDVQPGVVIKLSGSLNVDGTLLVAGTSEAPVLFTSPNDLGQGEWQGIRLREGSGASQISHAVIRHSGTGVAISSSSPTVTDSTVTKNKSVGITVSGGQPTLSGNTITNNTLGIEFSGSPDINGNTITDCRENAAAIRQTSSASKATTTKVRNNLIERCGGSVAAISVNGSAVSMGGNTVRESKGIAIAYGSTPSNTVIPPDIDDNTLEGNAGNTIWLNGELTESSTWEDRGYPIVAAGGSDTVSVGPGATLKLEPGVAIKIAQFNATMTVRGGVLKAAGTAEDPVIFTSLKDDTVGGDTNQDGAATSPAAGDYIGIRFEGSSPVVPGRAEFNHVLAKYGGAPASCGLCGGGGPFLRFAGSTAVSEPSVLNHTTIEKTVRYAASIANKVAISNSTFSKTPGLEISGLGNSNVSDSTFADCTVNDAAIYQTSSGAATSVDIHGNTVERCGGGSRAAIDISGSALSPVSLGGNTVRESAGKAISYFGSIPTDISENTLEGNSSNAIWLSGTVAKSAAWKDHGFPIVAQSGSESFKVATGVTLTLEPGLVIKTAQSNSTIRVEGDLQAAGTAEDPVIFTSIKDDATGGDTNQDGAATSPAAGDYIGVRFESGTLTQPPGRGDLDHVLAKYGGAPASCGQCGGGGPMFSFNGPSVGGPNSAASTFEHSRLEKTQRSALVLSGNQLVADNEIDEATGIEFTGSPEIEGNTITDCRENAAAIRQTSSALKTTTIKIHDNVVERCGGSNAAISVNGTAVTMGDNTVRESKGIAIAYGSTPSTTLIPPDIDDNTLEGNSSNAIWLNGELTESSTWEDRGYPIVAAGGSDTFAVGPAATLKLEPGVAIKVAQSNSTVAIKGTLQAAGTKEDPVVVTSIKDDTVGGDTNQDGSATGPAAGDYIGFRVDGGSSTQAPGRTDLDYLVANYGGAPASCGLCGGGGPLFNFAAPASGSPASAPSVIKNSRMTKTVRLAISASGNSMLLQDNLFEFTPGVEFSGGGSPEISGNRFKDCESSSAIAQNAKTVKSTVNIHGNTTERCGSTTKAAIEASGTALTGTSLGGNRVDQSPGKAIAYSGDLPGDITDNTLKDNASDEIWVSGTVSKSATWENGGSAVRVDGTITVPAGVILDLQPGLYLRKPNMNVKGTLLAQGSAGEPIVFTGVKEEPGEWGGVFLEAGSGGSVLSYVEMAYGGSGQAMLNIGGVSPKIINSTFRRASTNAIRVQSSGQPTIEWNRFRKNNMGLRVEGTGKLKAPHNDWGCVSGPKPTGCGDQVTSNVEWEPPAVLEELPRLCPGTTTALTSLPCLLDKYQPLLRLDSEENYTPDSAAGITDNWGDEWNGLWAEGEHPYSNSLWAPGPFPLEIQLAESRPGNEEFDFDLTLASLGPTYPNGVTATSEDWIDERNEPETDAHWLQAAGYMNAAYGRALVDGTGKTWLLYWYWYYYNPLGWEGIGVHEGDWESVLVGLDKNNKPDEVIFSQHGGGARCELGEYEETEQGGPVAYVGLDSHANYPQAGSYEGPVLTDTADGNGFPMHAGLEVIDGSPPSWILWPGHWGGSHATFEFESDSPVGPAFQDAWEEPAGYAEGAHGCLDNLEESPERSAGRSASAPSIEGSDLGERPRVRYSVPGADGKGFWPRLRITVQELNDGGLPPRSKTYSQVEAEGEVVLPFDVDPDEEAVVKGSLLYADGRRVYLTPELVR